MAAFGQSAPALPQIYTNQALFQFTKMGMASHLAKVLVTVGMEPRIDMWTVDLLSVSEAVLESGNNNTSTHVFPFMFPDTTVFTIDNENWRPFIAIVVYLGGLTTAASSGKNKDYLRVDLGIMREGAVSQSDTRGRYRQFTTQFDGWGGQDENVSTNGTGAIGDLARGLAIFKPDWKPYESYAGAGDTELLSVKNIFCYLGPAGLFLYAGTGSTRDTFGNLMAAGFCFNADRLPGRAAAQDPNINRINPVLAMPLLETETEVYNGSRLRFPLLGVQHDLEGSLSWVWADIWNLENAEIPFYPDQRPNTVPSPRELASGSGAHILGRIVTIPKALFTNSNILYGPVNPRITGTDTRPTFAQVFAAPRCRLCDITAPLGDYEDPDTLENWRIVPYPGIGATLGLYSENAQITSVLDFGAKTLIATRVYDFSSVSGDLPNSSGTATTVASSPAGSTMSLIHNNQGSFGINSTRFESTAATDNLICDMTPFSASVELILDVEIAIPITDASDSVYELQFDLRIRGGDEGENYLRFRNSVRGTYLNFTFTQGANEYFAFVPSAGANTASPIYNFATYVATVVRDSNDAAAPIQLQLGAARNGTPDDTVIEIQAVRLNVYRYL